MATCGGRSRRCRSTLRSAMRCAMNSNRSTSPGGTAPTTCNIGASAPEVGAAASATCVGGLVTPASAGLPVSRTGSLRIVAACAVACDSVSFGSRSSSGTKARPRTVNKYGAIGLLRSPRIEIHSDGPATSIGTCTLDGKLMYSSRSAAKTAARQAQCKGAVISVCGDYYHWTSAGRAAAEAAEAGQ